MRRLICIYILQTQPDHMEGCRKMEPWMALLASVRQAREHAQETAGKSRVWPIANRFFPWRGAGQNPALSLQTSTSTKYAPLLRNSSLKL